MESLLFVVLGIVGGAIVGFAIAYFASVSKLQKKLASAKKKLERAQSANEDTESLQSQLEAQKSDYQAAASKLQSLESAHQAQISELETQHAAALQAAEDRTATIEAELEALRQSSVSPDQIPADNSEEVAVLQARLAEVEQQHQANLQDLETRHQAELESLRQTLTVVPPTSTPDLESEPEAEPSGQGNWGAAAIAGGVAAIGAGVAAFAGFGQSSPPETTEEAEELDSIPEDFTPATEPEPIAELETPTPEWTEEPAAEFSETPFDEPVAEFSETPFEPSEVLEISETEAEADVDLTSEWSDTPGLEAATGETFELTEELLPVEAVEAEADQSPFDQPEVLEEDAFPEAFVNETEDISPFATPETPVESDNWVDAPDLAFGSAEATETSNFDFGEEPTFGDLAAESASPFEPSPETAIDTENWVDTGETSADSFSEFADFPEAGLLDIDSISSDDAAEAGAFTSELPDMGTEDDPMLGLELPDLAAEPESELGEFSFEDQNLEELSAEIPDGDQLLAELTGTGDDNAIPDLFSLEETTAETAEFGFGEDLSLPSNPGDTLEMPDSFLADIPSFIPESDLEDISTVGAGSDDDLDFLLQLQEDEPPSYPGEEFLPEFNDDEPLSSGFPTMELLADDNSELSDLLGEVRPAHESDPFINILDESPTSSDNDLLALLQDDVSGVPHQPEGDDDLFSGLEGMLNTDTPDNESDLDDLDALLSTSGGTIAESGSGHDDIFSLEDLGLGDDEKR